MSLGHLFEFGGGVKLLTSLAIAGMLGLGVKPTVLTRVLKRTVPRGYLRMALKRTVPLMPTLLPSRTGGDAGPAMEPSQLVTSGSS